MVATSEAQAMARALVLARRGPVGINPRVLWEQGSRDVWLEGGPTLAAALLRAGVVDEVVAYLAPTLLGAGASIVADLGITGIEDATRFNLVDVAVIGRDIRVVARPAKAASDPFGNRGSDPSALPPTHTASWPIVATPLATTTCSATGSRAGWRSDTADVG